MKSSKFTLLLIALTLTVAVAGCKKKPIYTTQLPGHAPVGPLGGNELPPVRPVDTTGMVDSTAGAGGGPGSVAFPHGLGHDGWTKNPTTFEAQTVYFDYDSAVIKTSEKTKIEVVAAYLQSNPGQAVLVEGHCDERGTEEYNRALGERRALAVREALIGAGIAPERADTISYGEDHPADPGHTKAAWSKNRRGAFVLLTPPQ